MWSPVINTSEIRDNPLWLCRRTGDQLTEWCTEQDCAFPYYNVETVNLLCDALDKAHAEIARREASIVKRQNEAAYGPVKDLR